MSRPTRKTGKKSSGSNGQFAAAIVDTHGTEPVRTVVHRVLVEAEPFRTATNGLEMGNVDGVRIGTAAS